MSKAKEKAWEWASKNKLDPYSMGHAYADGYQQAEKDLELTNEDVYDIWRIYNEVCAEGKIFGFDETSQEVLKRFKDLKK